MKKLLLVSALVTLGAFSGSVLAKSAECEAKAEEKKLAGAAKTSFVKKCEKDMAGAPAAAASAVSPECEKSAADKKLHGAAKTSHIKKCMADAKK